MSTNNTYSKPNLILSVLQNRCPACRRGKIFSNDNAYNLKHFTEMHSHCEVCGEDFEREIGFYYGTSYVSYALTVAFSVATFIAWWVIIGFSLYDNRMFWWLGVNGTLLVFIQPPIMRLSRTIWLTFFVKYKGLPQERHTHVHAHS